MNQCGLFACLTLILVGCVSCGGGKVNNDELYMQLGVSKTATTKEIRIAFKKLALEKHPDKNKDDPNANENFIKINRAYEILKDEELRKKYDTYGEDGLKDNHNQGQNYQSWHFYQQNFGIYDNDPEVVTLSRSDFMQSVESTDTIWFVNFYSTQCSHCHDLAPTWRELAKQLDGVVKIGAVNCMDDWLLCNQQQIPAFPSLIMYPKKEKFIQEKTFENLMRFALSFTRGQVTNFKSFDEYKKELAKQTNKPWLISYCITESSSANEHDDTEINYEINCLDDMIKKKIAIILRGLVRVASIDCSIEDVKQNICDKLKPPRSSPLVFYSILPELDSTLKQEDLEVKAIQTADYKQISQLVLSYLPDIEILNDQKFKTILDNLRLSEKKEKPWLIQFVKDYNQNEENSLKKLPMLLSTNYNFGRVDCGKLLDINDCHRFQIFKYPAFVLFKSASYLTNRKDGNEMSENWYEINYSNRQSPEDLAAFVKENAHTSVRTLTQFDQNILDSNLKSENKLAYFVDFFAPWCPPCMNLLPEFRKASKLESSVSFGTIDCSINHRICEQYGVHSYPTTILFNNSKPFTYFGHHSSQDISDFVQDILKPSVVILTYETFHQMVATKPIGKLWLVDFYASWCGPCQQLAPEWRKLAKRIDKNMASVGQVDCVIEQRLCSEQGISSYPNIRAYPSKFKGISQFYQFQGWNRDANSLLQWAADFLPSKTEILDYHSFESQVLANKNADEPWLIYAGAPWCGHCQIFAPKFEIIASKLEGRVKCGKVNCQEQQYLCQRLALQGYPSIIFFPIPKSDYVNWSSGENMFLYEVDQILNEVESKLKSRGYLKKKIAHKNSEL